MYKVVFIDIDGTLKNDFGEITDRTKEAIKRTEKYGEKGEFLKELALYMMERNK